MQSSSGAWRQARKLLGLVEIDLEARRKLLDFGRVMDSGGAISLTARQPLPDTLLTAAQVPPGPAFCTFIASSTSFENVPPLPLPGGSYLEEKKEQDAGCLK